jgi:hypothetical protein
MTGSASAKNYSQFRKGQTSTGSTALDNRAEGLVRAGVLRTRDDFKREIRLLWDDVAEKFLLIGRYLVKAKETLDHGEYQTMIERELPFGYQVARQLKTVAEKIDSGYIDANRMPKSYTTAFVLVTMSTDEIREAEARGLVRADVKRNDLITFLKEVRSSSVAIRTRELREYRKLRRQRDAILSRMAELESKYGDDLAEGDYHEDGDGLIIDGTAVEIDEPPYKEAV